MSQRAELLNATEHRVIRYLKRVPRPLSAYEIQNALGIRHPNTVYRALQRLLEFGLVHRIETRNAFIACDDPEERHKPGFIVCNNCGLVEEFDSHSVFPVLQAEAAKRKFLIEKSTIELLGRCSHCIAMAAKRRSQCARPLKMVARR